MEDNYNELKKLKKSHDNTVIAIIFLCIIFVGIIYFQSNKINNLETKVNDMYKYYKVLENTLNP